MTVILPEELSQTLPDDELSFVFGDRYAAGQWLCRQTDDGGFSIRAPSGITIPPPDIIAFAPPAIADGLRFSRFADAPYDHRSVEVHLPAGLDDVMPPGGLAITLGVPRGS
jgi:hypothetical protein